MSKKVPNEKSNVKLRIRLTIKVNVILELFDIK